MASWFSHSGDLGDIIYALPAIRAAGGGILYLFDAPGKSAHGMSAEKVARIRPLLMRQPYIHDVVFRPDAPDHDLNGFRDHHGVGNLADMHLSTLELSWRERATRWLEVDYEITEYPIIFSRSPRYHNERFPWQRIRDTYARRAAFIGHPTEYGVFCQEFGDVPYARADNLLEVARIIAGCRLFIGNQSCPEAIAQGLKKRVILEVCPYYSHGSHFQRFGCLMGWDEKIELPSLRQIEQMSCEAVFA